ncbi:MAG: ComEC/Rec2 family competence protein [Vicinamibacterales bacterium]
MRTALIRSGCGLLVAMLMAATLSAQQPARTTLDIYVIDVEGGNATLFVAPSGESVLIDSGNPGAAAARDVTRIVAAAADAGLAQIDHLVTTHWHGDHYGAMAELAAKIPIRHYVDHGPAVQSSPAVDEFLANVYPKLVAQSRRTIVKPGETIPLTGVDWRIVTAGGNALPTPLPGAGQANAACAGVAPQQPDPGENAQSVGSIVSFGQFRVAHLGDLTWNKELELMCPSDRIGPVDLFIVSHHGQAISNSPALVHALRPRVAVMNNGTRKGGQPEAMRTLHSSPGLEDLWQIHFSLLSGQEYTVPGLFIANTIDDQPATMPVAALPPPAPGATQTPAPVHNGAAHWIKVSARTDGSFTVANSRNGFTKRYGAR